jgi:hypothetical protein
MYLHCEFIPITYSLDMLLHTTHPSGKTITIVDMRSEKKETLFCEKLEMKLSEAFQQ